MHTTARAGRLVCGLAIAGTCLMAANAAAAPPPAQNGALTWVGLRGDGWKKPFRWMRFTVAPNGGRLRSEPVHTQVMNLVASPDGRRIAYQYGTNIYVARRDGSHARRVAGGGGHPSWAPDGKRLVYEQVAVDIPGQRIDGGLVVARLDGGGKRRLTRGDDRYPAWSPDGTTIAFVRDRFERGCAVANTLSAVGARGGRVRRLLAPGYTCGLVGRPTWSPRGDRVAVQLDRLLEEVLDDGDIHRDQGTHALARARVGINTVHADGKHRRRITRHGEDPVWAPDGREIAFHAHLASCTGEHARGDALCSVALRNGAVRTVATLPPDFYGALGLTWFPEAR